ncbi:MAG: hypothetical protein FJ316_07385 [SAR202 cluster bacterium]|nr:hypothetical protein [SAR202 cluster bacterium]
MIKAVLAAFGIMLGLALIPLVHLVGIPFGPFIGGYFGIRFAADLPGTYASKGVKFGALLSLVALLFAAAAALVLMNFVDLSHRMFLLLWIGVVVFTLYTGSMGTLGAMFALIKMRR